MLEGQFFTAFVLTLVAIEFFVFVNLEETGVFGSSFFASLSISIFFATELSLRYYLWFKSFSQLDIERRVVGFFMSPFRSLDGAIVGLDILLTLMDTLVRLQYVIEGSAGAQDTGAGIKFGRVARSARASRWFKSWRALALNRTVKHAVEKLDGREEPKPVRRRHVHLSKHSDTAANWQDCLDSERGVLCVSSRMPVPLLASQVILSTLLEVKCHLKLNSHGLIDPFLLGGFRSMISKCGEA